MRAAPEQQMISDIHCMIAAGQDLDWIDAQGATLVRRGARTQTRQRSSLYRWGSVRGLGPPPDPLWDQGWLPLDYGELAGWAQLLGEERTLSKSGAWEPRGGAWLCRSPLLSPSFSFTSNARCPS